MQVYHPSREPPPPKVTVTEVPAPGAALRIDGFDAGAALAILERLRVATPRT